MKSDSWKRHRKRKQERISIDRIIQLAQQYNKLRERALFILIYQTAGRISEIIPKK